MIEEEPEWITYDVWGAYLPEAPDGYKLSIGASAFEEVECSWFNSIAMSPPMVHIVCMYSIGPFHLWWTVCYRRLAEVVNGPSTYC